MRANLKTVSVNFMGGLVSNINEVDLAQGGALLQAENCDFSTKFRTISKCNGSERQSPNLGGVVKSVHYYEYTDLAGAVQRKKLALQGSDMYEIVSSGSAPTIGGAATSLTTEPLSDTLYNDRLHLCSKNNVPFKYDGNSATKWGVYAPGTTPTEKITFASTAAWTGTNATLSTDTAIYVRGGSSMKIAKAGGGVNGTAAAAGLALNMTTPGGRIAYLWVYFDYASYDFLATAVVPFTLIFGDVGYANSSTWVWNKGELFPGWNLLSFDLLAADIVVGAGAPLAAVTNVTITLTTANAADTPSARVDFLYTVDDGNAAAATGAAGAITAGTYHYKTTFLTKYGVESNAGEASPAVVNAGALQHNVTGIPVSTDAQVIARRLYRDINDGVYKFVAQINDNSTTTYTDNAVQTALSTDTPPEAASATSDNSPPDRMLVVRQWKNHIFGINAMRNIEVDVTNGFGPEEWPLVSRLTFPESLVAMEVHETGLLLFASDSMYRITGSGTDDDPFVTELVNPSIGANNWRTVCTVNGKVVAQHENRVYQIDDVEEPWLLNGPVLEDGNFGRGRWGMLIHDRSRERILCSWASSEGSGLGYMAALFYAARAIATVAGAESVSPTDLRNGLWASFYPDLGSVTFYSLCVIESSTEEPELWAGDSLGYVQRLATRTEGHGYQIADGSTNPAISLGLQALIPLHPVPGGRGSVRYLEIDATGGAGPFTATLTYYDSPMRTSSLGSVSLSIAGNKSTMTPAATGVRASYALLSIVHSTNEALTIRSIRAHVIPRFSNRGQRS